MSEPKYVKFERVTILEPGSNRELVWRDINAFAEYIRSIAPAGEIRGVYGIGYSCQEHEYAQQVLQLVVETRRPMAEVEREKAEQEALRQHQAELAAIEAAKKAKIAQGVRLRKTIERLQKKITENTTELNKLLEENVDILGEETKGEPC